MENIFLPNNVITYTSESKLEKINAEAFGEAEIVIHSFENGEGVLVFNKEVEEVEGSAFSECPELTSIIIPESVELIGWWAFDGCFNLDSIIVNPNNPIYNAGDEADCIIETETNTLIVGCNTTIIPDYVTKIDDYAFCGRFLLESINIPDSVTEIGECAFYGCSDLESLTVNPDNPVYNDGNGANCIIETATNTLIVGCQTTVIPDYVTKIGDSAFDGCYNLTSIIIPDSVTEIGECAFYGCSDLESISIPASVTKIGDRAFSGCPQEIFPEEIKQKFPNAFIDAPKEE